MYFSVKPNKDTTISNLKIRSKNRSGSNSGRSEIVELYSLTESVDRRGKSRILLQFDLAELSQSINQELIPSSSVEFRLKLKNADHKETVPYSYDIKVYPLSRSWDEGRGLSMEDEDLKDDGVANWTYATTTQPWTIPGADFISSSNLTASQHFDFGTEDLDINISNIVYAWLTGNVANNGLLLKYDDFYETSSTDFYVKKFFSRHAMTAERLPKIDILWEKTLTDDRSKMYYNHSGTLSYYRYLNGIGDSSINKSVYVDIVNSSSVVVQTLTASQFDSNTYQISGVFVSPDAGTQIYRDVWFTSTQQLFTGTFTPIFATGSFDSNSDDISVNITNLKNLYSLNERSIIRVFAKQKDYKPAVVKIGTLQPDPILLKNAYFQIENASTNEVLVPFSTGSLKYSKLSYDSQGNFFELWTSSFAVNNVYKIKILADFNGQKIIFDKGWSFKIV